MKNQSFLSLAKNRYSTFVFSKKKIPFSKIKQVLEAGRWSPSSQNSQPWHFLVVEDPQKIEELSSSSAYGFFRTAPPILILICTDCSKINENSRGVKNGLLGMTEAMLSIGCCAMTMVYQAEAIGLQSCLLTPNMNYVKKLKAIKGHDFVPIMIALGYEQEKPVKENRVRRELSELVRFDSKNGGFK